MKHFVQQGWFLFALGLPMLFFVLIYSSCSTGTMGALTKLNESVKEFKNEIKKDRSSDTR